MNMFGRWRGVQFLPQRGALVVIPPAVPAWRVIDPLPERLHSLIRRHNRVFRDPARIQLRAAFNMGPVHHDNHGYIGTDVDVLFRLLDAAALKHALASSGAELDSSPPATCTTTSSGAIPASSTPPRS